jgi:hypothetical protein
MTRKRDPVLVDGLVGCWFHAFSNNEIKWQGHIVGEPVPGIYLVQLFDWFLGDPQFLRLVPLADMMDWQFYRNDAEMKDWHDSHGGRGTPEDSE